MQRVQLEALKPSMLTDEEFAKYVTLHTPEQLPMSWVAELVVRFIAKREDELFDTAE